MDKSTYYTLWFRLDQRDGYFIWISNEPDGVVLNSDKMIVVYRDFVSFTAYTIQSGVPLEQESPILHDLDVVQTWLSNPQHNTIDCRAFLAAWNLFDDIRASVEPVSDSICASAGAEDIYDKLFFGNNLPAITKEGMTYIPEWTSDNVAVIADILGHRLRDFRNRLFFAD